MHIPKKENNYTITVGIECHVQLKTKTKLFAAVSNDARNAEPNTLISHICLGMPGALPVLNEEAIHLAAKAAFALGTVPQKNSKFDRKHYFYPDLPKGYQITQFDQPIILGGHVKIASNGLAKNINITRAHLEEDAGKSTHPAGQDYSLVDLNRAGTPLLEIVSEPEIHSSAEAKAYAKELYLLMRYADVSDANLFYGNMRFDVNVSVSKTNKLGIRSETKNLNSFKSVEKAVDYEAKRQIDLLEKGDKVLQETRGWDDAKQKTFSQRSKEDSHDYRYFPDPDIPPVELSDKYIKNIQKDLPTMPDDWRKILNSLELNDSQIDTLLISEVDSGIKYLKNINKHLNDKPMAKFLADWYINITIPQVNDNNFVLENSLHHSLELEIYRLIKSNKLSSTNAKALYTEITRGTKLPASIEDYARTKGYIQVSDEKVISEIVKNVLAHNPKAATDVAGGEIKAIGYLVGQIMAQSKGQADPALAQKLIKKQLHIE